MILPKQQNLVLDHRYFNATFRDFSGNGNEGTPTSGVYFKNTEDGRKAIKFGGADAVDVSDDASLQLTEGTIVAYGDFKLMDEQSRLVAKRDAGGTNYDFHYNDATTEMCMFDGSTNACITQSIVGAKTIGCVFGTGEAPDFFLDGVLKGTSASTNTVTADDAPMTIGNLYSKDGSQDMTNPMSGALVWNVQLTEDEMGQVHEWIMAQRTPTYPKMNFVYPSLVDAKENGTLFAASLENVHGSVVDKLGGSQGTITAAAREEFPGKIAALTFQDNLGEVVFGDISDLGSGDFTLRCLLRINTTGDTGSIITKAQDTNNRWLLYQSASDVLGFFANASSTVVINSANNVTLQVGRLYHVIVTGDRSGNLTYYLDAVAGDSDAFVDASSIDNTGNFQLGSDAAGVNTAANTTVGEVQIWNRVLSSSEIIADYNKYAKLPYFLDDLKDANVSVAAEGGAARNFLSNTDWRFFTTTGNFKIADATGGDLYEKEIHCSTGNATGVLYRDSKQAYGTWEFDFYKGADANEYEFAFVATNVDANTRNNYSLFLYSDESIGIARHNSGARANLLRSSASYISNSTWYRARITRAYNGDISLYIKSLYGNTDFQSWTLADSSAAGTNPVNDTTYTSSIYTSWLPDTNDRIKNFKFWHGVIDPT